MYDSTSHMQPGYRFQYQVPPKSPAFSTIRKSVIPCLPRSIAVSIPAKPPPTTTTVVSSTTGSLVKPGSTNGSLSRSSKSPVSSRHWAMPSGRRRFCCSVRYR